MPHMNTGMAAMAWHGARKRHSRGAWGAAAVVVRMKGDSSCGEMAMLQALHSGLRAYLPHTRGCGDAAAMNAVAHASGKAFLNHRPPCNQHCQKPIGNVEAMSRKCLISGN